MGMESVYKLSVLLNVVDDLTGKISSIQGNVSGSIQKMNNAFGTMQKAGAAMTGVGGAILGVGAKLVTSTFDTQNALGELSSLGVKDLKAVENAAKSFSDTWAGTSKADFITASYDIKSGIASLTDEGVAQFTQLAALTGKATKSTTEEMGSLFATGYGIYKGAYDDMSDLEFGEMFSAGIATAVKNYKTSGSEMASSISALGATATNNNVPLEEQLAIIGQLQTTMSGSEAATKYKSFLNQAASAGEKLGLKLTDTNNQLLSTPDILEQLKTKYGDTIDAVEKQELKEAFGTDEAVAMIDLLYNNVDTLKTGVDDLSGSMKNGKAVTQEMAEAIQNTPEQKFQTLKQQIHNNVEELGSGLLPTVNNSMDKISGLIAKGSEWIGNNQETVQTIMNIAMKLGVFLVVAGIVMGIVGTLGKVFLSVKNTIGIVKTAVMGLNTAFLASPVTWVIVGIVALIAIFAVLWSKSEAFRNFWKGLFAQVQGVVLQAWSTIQPVLQNLGQKLMELWKAVQPIIGIIQKVGAVVLVIFTSIFMGAIQGAISALTPLINAFSSFVSFVTNVVNAVVALFHGDFSGALTFVTVAVNDLKNVFINGFNVITSFLGGFASGLLNTIGGVLSSINNLTGGRLAAVCSTFRSKFESAKNIVSSVLDSIKSAFSSKLDAARSVVSGAINRIKSIFKFSWSLPKIKLPHISISGKFSLKPPSVPKFGIQWYKDGGILNGATIFGQMGNTMLGGGEAGQEAVLPLSELWKHMREVVGSVVKGENEESASNVQQTGANITSVLTSKASSVKKEKETTTTTSKEMVTRERWGKDGGMNINTIHFTVDISKIKDLPLLYKLLDELKDAQNRTDVPATA